MEFNDVVYWPQTAGVPEWAERSRYFDAYLSVKCSGRTQYSVWYPSKQTRTDKLPGVYAKFTPSFIHMPVDACSFDDSAPPLTLGADSGGANTGLYAILKFPASVRELRDKPFTQR